MPDTNPAFDAYIANAAPFAQPILTHVRKLVHKAVPGVSEEIKWSHLFFTYKGIILGNVAAFKAHCSVGFWGEEIAAKLREDGLLAGKAMGSLGRITSRDQLPPDKEMVAYWKHGAKLVDDGTRTVSYKRPPRVAKKEVEIPQELATALQKNSAAAKAFEAFSPSCQREYVDWITDAKRVETRAKRIAQTIEWVAEGKRRNWKYEGC